MNSISPIIDIFNGFWLCQIQKELDKFNFTPQKLNYLSNRPVKIINRYDFTTHVDKLSSKISFLKNTQEYFVTGKKKAQPCKIKQISKRRSQYTGVTRNSINYQTLIVVKRKKIYVGSFPLELDAAITFDFYSLLLHGQRATTNFSWKVQDIQEMIRVFQENKGTFEPQVFQSRISNIKF